MIVRSEHQYVLAVVVLVVAYHRALVVVVVVVVCSVAVAVIDVASEHDCVLARCLV